MILRSDARHFPLRDDSVNVVITSPPYWGQRDYGFPGQIGIEPIYVDYIPGDARHGPRVVGG